ncbi:tyrosine--tRNA ligase [Candidatus Curtissbacteria bacterium]|nr:tyrosine--tRNA ligase [Candidatus Curtissbacteria bacterium]
MDLIDKALTRGVEQILPSREGLQKLIKSKNIRLYWGIDPTGTHLHLGHTIPMRKLQEFADLGHEAILLIGTGTVLVGDPSQRKIVRGKITKEEIDENIKTWKEQAKKVLNFDKIQIKYNGDWLLKLTYPKIAEIASNISSIQLIKRDMFQERIKGGGTVWHHETLYPLMQGYDSVVMDVDLEIGGTDQTFNMLIGRELQKKMNNREKFVLTTPLISGTDGNPMSKSSGNCVWLDDSPNDMFGKIMSISDSQIVEYWNNLTDFPEVKLNTLEPLDAKKELAREIVRIYHGQEASKKAQEIFESTIQQKKVPEFINTFTPMSGATYSQVLLESGLAESMAEAKRKIQQGSVSVSVDPNNIPFIKVTDPRGVPTQNEVVKIGNRNYIKIIVKD